MEVTCTKCRQKIDVVNINVSKDTAFCNRCESLNSLSELLEEQVDSKFDIKSPVRGVEVNDGISTWRLIASLRSYSAIFIVPFTVVWAGGALSGLYGSQIVSGEFDIAKSLFGIPFLIGSVVLIIVSLMSLFGRTVVSVENGRALIFIGVGSIGWYRRFDWRSINRVSYTSSNKQSNLSLEGEKKLTFDWGLSSDKKYYIANYLRSKLAR